LCVLYMLDYLRCKFKKLKQVTTYCFEVILLAPPKGLTFRPESFEDASKFKICFQAKPHGPAFVGRQACPEVLYLAGKLSVFMGFNPSKTKKQKNSLLLLSLIKIIKSFSFLNLLKQQLI
ncbi:MAG TPA: hypothetical protein DCX87_00325, partial [Leeuwenhoekiella sp.]|nr:hypothetical protein [Leeuwenhoekiella sp.]